MSKMDLMNNYVKIGDIHVMRMERALDKMLPFLPIKEIDLETFTDEQFEHLEMIVGRFSKLQDMIGGRLFPLILEFLTLESSESKPMRDILDRLEKLKVLDSVDWWIGIREIRIHIAHEYPDNPQLMCQNLNAAVKAAGQLLKYWAFLKDIIKGLKI